MILGFQASPFENLWQKQKRVPLSKEGDSFFAQAVTLPLGAPAVTPRKH